MTQAFLSGCCSKVAGRLQTISLLVGLLTLSLSNPAIAQERLLRTLTVTGRGVETIPATATQVQLGVEVQGETATGVQQEVARRSASVVELLRSRNVEKLQTTGVRLNPIYSYENNVQRLTSYSAANTVSFRTSTEQAGTLLDDAVKAGATRIDSVSFTAADEAIAAAQQQALREATQDAQRQADAVLSSLNLSRKEVVNIQVNGATPPPPMPVLERAAFASDQVANTPIIGGEQEVQASVTLQISY
ncbi:SIMPL domain-containing protein [Microcoleus sp. FACHB-SPT15]|uniref:SIMPL domain-containing protein n=1 Tax=Microcoleus sp. FACHB-SPT15 TaxID=2692830 RepID=UPI00177CEB21|nr:SIMPL domain-containing protein [Microcoleus sp. FACHB-SPT15]MBD1809169.1 SIMPL domain-containing protein [Microcoleus sp. FACHB-SPT15]